MSAFYDPTLDAFLTAVSQETGRAHLLREYEHLMREATRQLTAGIGGWPHRMEWYLSQLGDA